jgi:hypothetical protein
MPALTQRPIPQAITVDRNQQSGTVEIEQDYVNLEVHAILEQAEQLYTVRDPANVRITRLKTALISKLQAQFDEENQLSLFDNLDNLAFRDPQDPNTIVVSSPDVSIQFRMKRSVVHKWETVRRSIEQEEERLRLEQVTLESNSSSGPNLSEIRGRRMALQWVMEQVSQRTDSRLTGRFVAAATRD